MRPLARLAGAILWLGVSGSAAAQEPPPWGGPASPPPAPAVLAVPYLPQSTLLCGGAALAMVERWWGRRGVFAEDFARLVRPERGGILTSDLAAAARDRGWDTRLLEGTPDVVQASLGAGVPVIALIEVGRDKYHFVVILAWDAGGVVYHDPADAPNRTEDETRFLSRWNAARRWALAIRPAPVPVPVPTASVESLPPRSMPCSPWVDRALDAAADNRLDEAVRLLDEAERACPSLPVIRREMAGVRFKQRRYAEALSLAGEYAAAAPEDELGWQLLATSRYLTGDRDGALEAWNRIGRPVIDLVRIEGTRHIGFRVLSDQIGVSYGEVLTPGNLALARRRLSDVPALRGAVVGYEPVPGGLTELRVTVDERPTIDPIWQLVLANATRALAQDEVELAIASPTRLGERWSAQWRWESARPRVGLGVAVPATLGIPGVIQIAENWEHFRFALDSGGNPVHEDRRRTIRVGFGGWLTESFRPAVSLDYDRWSEDRSYLTASARMEVFARGDRLRFQATGTQASGLSGAEDFTQLETGARWASAVGIARPSWSARAGWHWASEDAPLGAWPITGTNLEWAIPLRAHPATEGGLLDPRSAGRSILHAGLTGDYPVHRVGFIVIAAGAFLDAARLEHRADGSARNGWLLDAGAGLRAGLGDGGVGLLRIDLARGLVDGGTALTVGVQREWPPFD